MLLERFDKYFSDEKFNKNYLPQIKDYINSVNINLEQIERNLKNLYNSQSKLPYSSSTQYDYFKYGTNCWRCCKFKLGRCWKHKTCCNHYYKGYNLANSNEYLNLQNINFDEYTKKFDQFYKEIYQNSNYYVTSYNKYINDLDNTLETKKNELINRNNNFLNGLSEKINSIINEKLGKNLLQSSYNYYKNEINEKLPIELNDILEQWKNVYDKVYQDINSNVKKFKSSFNELVIIGSFYSNTYAQNITYDYSDFVNVTLCFSLWKHLFS